MPVIVVKAPPLSGKTGLAQLLAKKLGECASRSVVFLRANQMRVEDSVEVFFAKEVGESLCDFLQRSEERVLLIDEAQCTYTDSDFWKNIVKSTLSGGYNTELRIVLLSSFGSFDPLRKSDREGTPIQIPPRNTFSLRGDFGGETSEDEECEEFIDPVFVKPTLALTEGEFNEMAEGSVIQQCHDLAWNLASNHIGVAKGLLDFVNDRFKNKFSVTANDIERILLSRELVSWFQSMRGFPSIERFTTVVKYNALNDRVTAAGMLNILDQVACGNTYRFQNEFGSPGTQAALELLTKFGFLFEADNGCLNFASQMHLKVWLFSIRTDPIEYLVNCQDFDAFLVASISRMHGTRLAAFRKGNDCKKVRERQMQMELYTAICSILPRDFHVTPEWRTSHKKEYINLVVNLSKGVIWFLELLVDGKEAIEHEKRFLCGGKYSSSLNPKSKYGLIDFRESVAVRNEKPGFTHVSFGDGYKKAFVSCPSQEVKTVFPL
ncbi:hypothetical protein BDR26DRAFT_895574 [Obelidium mucronatum]|nr:hypothetical protein BDR26DRAFT_895574 [Obelidium mucronatum]